MTTLGPKAEGPDSSITALLLELSECKREVESRLLPQVYSELRRLAARYMRQERGNHTLQPTALVHEAYVRLVQQPQVPWQSRADFFATASHLDAPHPRRPCPGEAGRQTRRNPASSDSGRGHSPGE